jgi:hypothetical protein
MKTLLTFSLGLTLCFSLSAQSNLLTLGGSYRNTNYLSYTGKLPIGPQLGFSRLFSEKFKLQANVGRVTNDFTISRSNVDVFQEQDRTTYLEVFALFAILRRWNAASKLKGGIGYVGSRNTYEYIEQAVVANNEVSSLTTKDPTYYLHAIGLMVEYVQPISTKFVISASTGLNASLNRMPAYESIIVEQFSIGGTGTSRSSADERHALNYNISVAVGYVF